jgi:hypothetical protein
MSGTRPGTAIWQRPGDRRGARGGVGEFAPADPRASWKVRRPAYEHSHSRFGSFPGGRATSLWGCINSGLGLEADLGRRPEIGRGGQGDATINLSVFGAIRLGRQKSVPPANRDDPTV